MSLTLRLDKGSALSYAEMDGNFTFLSSSIPNIDTNIFATTGSNTFNGNQVINGNQDINGSLSQGAGTTIGLYSHAEGYNTISGIQAYYTNNISNGNIIIAGYGDVSSYFIVDNPLILDDSDYDSSYGTTSLLVSQSYVDAGNTVIQLYDLTVNTTTALIGSYYYPSLPNADYVIGNYSHAEGNGTKAIGAYSHAEGNSTLAIGLGSHAEGDNTQAKIDSSHAEGVNTQAIGYGSHAEGFGTIASGSYQHVSGKYNTHGDNTSLFIIGNGADDNNRSDAFKVRQSGSIILPVTSSGQPNWTGTNGEMIFGTAGAGKYVIWAYLGGAWRSGSLV